MQALVWWEPRNSVRCDVIKETPHFYVVVPHWDRDVQKCRVSAGVPRYVRKSIVEILS